jgi:hypothetical protein
LVRRKGGIVSVKDFFILGDWGTSSVELELEVEFLEASSLSLGVLGVLVSLSSLGAGVSSLFWESLPGSGDAFSLIARKDLCVPDRGCIASSTDLAFVWMLLCFLNDLGG